MAQKPTFDQLKQRIAKLEKELAEIKQTKKLLQERHKTLKTLIGLSPDPIAIIQGKYHVLVNSAWTQVFGYNQRDIAKGLGFYSFIQKKDMEAVRKRYDERLSGKKIPKNYRIDLVTKDGKPKPFVTTSTLIQYQGRPADLVIFQNISQQVQDKNALKESEDNFKALADNANDGIIVFVADEVIKYANKKILKVLGYSLKQIEKKRLKNLLHPNEYPRIVKNYMKTLKGVPYPTPSESIAIRKDGKKLPIEITCGKTTWKGQPADITIVRDITERKDSEKQLKKKDRKLEKKNARLEELNTALNVLLEKRNQDTSEREEKILSSINELIMPYLAELKKKGPKSRKEIFVEIIKRNLEEIISSNVNKLSSRYLNLTPTEIKVADLVKQGHKTKAIAELLGSSPMTISNHRKTIRKKLNLTEKGSNLRTHLLSFSR